MYKNNSTVITIIITTLVYNKTTLRQVEQKHGSTTRLMGKQAILCKKCLRLVKRVVMIEMSIVQWFMSIHLSSCLSTRHRLLGSALFIFSFALSLFTHAFSFSTLYYVHNKMGLQCNTEVFASTCQKLLHYLVHSSKQGNFRGMMSDFDTCWHTRRM